MDESDAVSRAKLLYPQRRVVDASGEVWVEEGWAQVRNNLYAVGVRRFSISQPDAPAFILRGFGKDWESALKMATIQAQKTKEKKA